MVIYSATFQLDTSGLDLVMKSAGSLSPLQHQMLRLICDGDDWCILVLAIFSDFLATSDLAIFGMVICILGVSKTRPLKKGSQKQVPSSKYHRLLVTTIFKVQLIP